MSAADDLEEHPPAVQFSTAWGPLRGAGLGLRPELAPELLRSPGSVDFLEVVAESCFVSAHATREAEAFAQLCPVLVHGVKLSLGSARGFEVERARKLGDLARRLRSPLVSEHACYVRSAGYELGHLTPVPRTREALEVLVRNTALARRALGDLPLALENVATTFRYPYEEAREGDFYSALVERTGCPLLLDVSNLYANARNEGRDPAEELARFPLEQVAMVHLAGGVFEDGYYFDDHAHPVPVAVLELLRAALPRMGDVPLLIERDAQFPPFEELAAEVRTARGARGRGATGSLPRATTEPAPALAHPLEHVQEELARSLVGPDAEHNALGLSRADLARSRGVLERKRADEALPLLPTLSGFDASRELALAVVRASPRARTMAGIADAFRIAQRAGDEGALREAAARDLLVLRARFSGDSERGTLAPRAGPYLGRARAGAVTLYAAKGPGSQARVRLFASRSG